MTLRHRAIPCVVLVVLPLVAGAVRPPDLPRVRLIATGGTISNRPAGRLTAGELLQAVPALERYAVPEAEQFANVASSMLSLEQWLDLARRINACFASDPGLSGVVVSVGTDTLEELAYFLNLAVKDPRPVVVVGSMRSPNTLGYDGAANLLQGFRVAADPAARSRGVLVVLNGEINAARDVVKMDTQRPHAFQTRGYGVLGVVDPDRVVFFRDQLKRHTARSEFDLSGITTLPRVDILMVYQGASGALIKAAVDQGAEGLVIASAGAGATSGTQMEGVAYAAERGVFVVTSSRTGGGRIALGQGLPATMIGEAISSEDAKRLLRLHVFLTSEDLTPVKARILLMVALTTGRNAKELQRIFTEY